MTIEKMPLAQFRLAPTHEVRTHKELCVMVHKREAFYSVTPERMNDLLNTEKEINYFSKSLEDMLNEMHSNGRIDHDVYQELFGLL
jgi:hypothetical protein